MTTADFTTHLLAHWKVWGDQTQEVWNKLLDKTTDDPSIIWIFGSTLVMLLSYWSYAAFFTFVDITNKPRWILKYKIQPEQNVPVDRQKLWKAIKQVLFNQIVVTTLGLYIGNLVLFKSWTPASIRQLPTMKTYLIDLALMSLLEEPLFYYAHRMLHHRSIYKYFHKKHHEWTSPIAAMTFYCHPVEHIVSNFGPIALMAGLLNVHVVVSWTFTILAIVNSMTDHTGYYFPFPLSKESVLFHDYHHAKFNYNFGVFGWLDKLHGTYRDMKTEKPQIKSKKPANKLNSKN
ncbi:fatty acid hydroxylase domain-containing protein 2-like [Calliphora vicina]|uniref:fatty acid hydroxylase domain-containing protein 2-like n=1 Tax=Calliphora vicina TaxID=7373 RepID=UPI00325BAEAF